ncbi:MAG: HIRAN domain-containing protein [Thermoguttaceae bacterium]|nr:HIRAN domain-containing protein [Thermoguttaceae bacterium]
MPRKGRRLSLTFFDTQEGPGAELFRLCREITADGRICKDDFFRLRAWLQANRDCQLPAVAFLCEAMDRITADKIVTREELADLYRRIERILPPEDRALARENRRRYLQKLKEERKRQEERLREAERQERLRRQPVLELDFQVAGVQYEGRGLTIKLFAVAGDPVYLVRDRNNRYSVNAVQVRLANGRMIGFVPESVAPQLAPLLDTGHRYRARIKKILTFADPPIPDIEGQVFHPEAPHEGLVDPNYIPPVQQTGCLPALVAVGIAMWPIAVAASGIFGFPWPR